jgi:hypothetical protein
MIGLGVLKFVFLFLSISSLGYVIAEATLGKKLTMAAILVMAFFISVFVALQGKWFLP